ncbi:eCIS core domain-containing protein, partial [Segeticoccus rhizosphaerae]
MTTQTGALEPLEQSVRHTIARGGQPIEAGVRRAMEARFGTDFSAVRVHA